MEKDLTVRIHDVWFNIPEKVRFVLVGGFNSFISFVFFVFLLHLFAQFFRDDTLRIYNWCRENFDIFRYIGLRLFVRQLTLALAWFLSSFLSFTTQRLLVFRAKNNSKAYKQYFKCLSTWFVGYLVNAVILEVLATFFEKIDFIPPLIESDIAQAFALVISGIVTYCLFKYFAFKKKKAKVTV